ncbi:MAG: aminopeptidase P family protein [Gemmatimonadales bacterium]|nr:aminopeptidase P family protein [Gemmatimonadales bacterium]
MTTDTCGQRQAALRSRLEGEALDALLVTHLPNIRYLTGFTGSAALLLIAVERAVVITDFRYEVQAPREVGSAAEVVIDPVSVWSRLFGVLKEHDRWRVGIESHVLTVADAARIGKGFRGEVVPVADVVEDLRVAKSADEVAAIRAAAGLAQEALAEVLPSIRVGRDEFAIAADLEGALRRRGSEWHPFPTIVASGPRSALPHARTSERAVESGELLLVDFGAQVDGYCADLTRTYVVGTRADERQRMVYDLVGQAQRLAMERLRAGMTGAEADALARDVIRRRGFGDAFGHALGHGLGLEVHEAPRLAASTETVIPAHAVVTVEPGIYLGGWGGVRLEDDVYLGPDGPECLSSPAAELIELM